MAKWVAEGQPATLLRVDILVYWWLLELWVYGGGGEGMPLFYIEVQEQTGCWFCEVMAHLTLGIKEHLLGGTH